MLFWRGPREFPPAHLVALPLRGFGEHTRPASRVVFNRTPSKANTSQRRVGNSGSRVNVAVVSPPPGRPSTVATRSLQHDVLPLNPWQLLGAFFRASREHLLITVVSLLHTS